MNPTQLNAAIENRSLFGAYLLYGAEEFTKQEAISRILDLLMPELKEINYAKMDAPTWEELLSAAAQLPFFDRLRIILVTDFSEKDLNEAALLSIKKGFDPYEALFSAKECVLLFVRRGAGHATEFQKRFSDADRAISFDAITEDDAVFRILRLAAQRGVTISKGTARVLVQQIGTDGFRIKQEVEKLTGYVGRNNTITEETLKIVVTPNVEYRAFEMLDAFLMGNLRKGITTMERAIRSKEAHPLQIAAFFEGRLKLILMVREMLDRGKSKQEILARVGGKPYALDQSIRHAKRKTAEELRRAVAAFSDIQPKLVRGILKEEEALTLAVYEAFS